MILCILVWILVGVNSTIAYSRMALTNLKCQVLEINKGGQYYLVLPVQLELQICKIKVALEKAGGSSIVKLTPTNRYAIAQVAQPNNLTLIGMIYESSSLEPPRDIFL